MALVVYDRVQETTATTGTGTITLGGAVAGYQSFAVVGNGNTTFYCIVNGSTWEVGIGTYSTTGPTLARTTVLSNSSGTTSPITLSGASNVFVTYPSEKSVNLDASGNVSPLGTIASGVWQGSTIQTAYGGTGVTTSSGASSNVLRDANSNITANNFLAGYTSTTSAAGTTVLTAASTYYQKLAGSTTQTYQLPIATTLSNGAAFIFDNDSTGVMTIVDSASGAVDTVQPGALDYIFLEDNSTSAGSWGKYSFIPGTYDFALTTASFGNATISSAVWNGTTIATGYGGTGLTTFAAANNAIYSTSASALAAGTLPIAAGGTAATTFTTNGVIYGNSTSALGVTAAGTTGQVLIATTGAAPSWGAIPSTAAVTSITFGTTGLTPSTASTGAVSVAGTLSAANGGTGVANASGSTITLGGSLTYSGAFTQTWTRTANTSLTLPTSGTVISTGTNMAANPVTGTPSSTNFLRGDGTWSTAVTSVAQSFTGGLISVSGSPVTTSGTLALTVAGTSGGIPYFSSASTWASSAALTANGVVYGGGAGAAPVATAAGTTGQVLAATTSAAPSWTNISSLAITSVSGTTNQITASTTSGAVTLSLPTSITTGQYIANQSISGSATQGAFAYGTLNGSDTGIFASYQTSIAGYAYMALQNTSSNAAATTDIALYNDTASLGKYIDIGINSSAFTGTGNFSLANAGYIYTNGGDLALGTYSANGIHFIVNNGATDAMTISSAGVVSLGTALAVGSGGTGLASLTANYIPYGNGTSAFQSLSTFTFDGTTQAAPVQRASQGFFVNANTNTASYSLAAGSNMVSAGPFTVATSTTITIATGSRWVVV